MDFTNAEKERINQLYGHDFEGITPADAMLIGRWEAWKATNEELHKAQIEAIRAESEQQMELTAQQAELAMANLRESARMARERYERGVTHEQE